MNRWLWLRVSIGAMIALYAAFVASLAVLGRREDARAFVTFIPDCAVLMARLVSDPRVPKTRKLVLVLLGTYLASPLDLVPDFIPVAGQLDDAILVVLVLRSLVRSSGKAVVAEHWPGPERSLDTILRLAALRTPAHR